MGRAGHELRAVLAAKELGVGLVAGLLARGSLTEGAQGPHCG